MAYGNPGYEDMDSPASASEKEAGEMDAKHEDMEHGEEYPLPIGVLAGKQDEFNVGDEVILRITAKHPDQIFVTYAPAKEQEKGKGEEGMGEEAEMGGEKGGSKMASMSESMYS